MPPILVAVRAKPGLDRVNSHLLVIPLFANTTNTTTASHDQKVYGIARWNRVFNAQIAPRGQKMIRVMIARMSRAVEAILIFILCCYYRKRLLDLQGYYRRTSPIAGCYELVVADSEWIGCSESEVRSFEHHLRCLMVECHPGLR